MASLYWIIRQVLERDDGQTMVEYEMLILLIAIVCIALLVIMGNTIRDAFYHVTGEIHS